MRTALCLSGQIRSFDLTKQNLLEHIIRPNNCDVFCHFWHKDTKEEYKFLYSNEDGKITESEVDTEKYGSYENKNLHDVIDFLDAKVFLFEEPYFQANAKSMFYSIWMCNQLKSNYELRHGFIYDVVVRARSDLIYSHEFEFPKCEENTIHVKDRPIPGKLSVNDWFAYGNSNSMNIYSKLFNEYEGTQRIEERCPEEILKKHLDNHNIQTSVSGVGFHIVREDGKEVW